ncbi:MAG: DUF448 domain-containing protein [Actinobacteria bacterium QS_5_72_10]|nr:MAG: DUF448 domain-containing protein [Actinobacteria bacterium QS_5_72_10]
MSEPIRTCLGCRRRRSRAELTRLVARGGEVCVDAAADQPGRGAWVCPDDGCAERALRDGGRRLRRALRVDAAAVTLEPNALRATIAARRPGASDNPGVARGGGSRREAIVAAFDDELQPSRFDASRGVPT